LKINRDVFDLVVGITILSIVVICAGTYVRSGGSEIFLVVSLAAVPTGLTLAAITYLLRKADRRVELIWCSLVMILIRSLQVWKVGIDFIDELGFIRISQTLFQEGRLLGYLKYYPVNIPFAGVFYALYTIWRNPEVFEVLAYMVYPLLVLGYYFMVKEILKIKAVHRDFSNPAIPAIMFLPYAPTFVLIPTYYWPQLLGLIVLCFSFASLLHLTSCKSDKARRWVIVVVALAILLPFSHSISTVLFLLTILFFYFTMHDRTKRSTFLFVGAISFITFIVAHLDEYSSIIRRIILALFGDVSAWRYIERYSFPDIASVARRGPIVTLAHIGFYCVIGTLILVQRTHALRVSKSRLSLEPNSFTNLLTSLFQYLRSEPITFSFFGFGILSFVSAVSLGGNFLDPVRMLGWASLLALPQVIPNKKANAVVFMVILLGLFFLLVWTVYSPWGSPFGSSPNLNKNHS